MANLVQAIRNATAQQDAGRKQRAQKRARRKLAKIRLAAPNELTNVKPGRHGNFSFKERQAIRDAYANLGKSQLSGSKHKTHINNPLLPLSGKSFKKEVNAEAKLQYGPQFNELKQDLKDQDTHTALVGSAYDAYTAALGKALANINAADTAAVNASDTRTDTAYKQDTGAAQTDEGKKAADALRALSNSNTAALRGQAAGDTALLNQENANSLLSKAEALRRENDNRQKIIDERKALKKERGAFKTSTREKLRQDERTYALGRKEFGLKTRQEKFNEKQAKQSAADKRKGDNAQVLIAKLYANADKAKAKATIRVAKLQLKKGKIDQNQYRKIVNVYHGLPAKGGSSNNGSRFNKDERTKISQAVIQLQDKRAAPGDRAKAVDAMIRGGLSRAAANAAWRRYVKRNHLNNGKNFPPNKR